MSRSRVSGVTHVCSFTVLDDLRGKARTYEGIKAAVLEAGHYSVFDIRSDRDGRFFDRLERDPEIETFRNPPGYPWIKVRKRKP